MYDYQETHVNKIPMIDTDAPSKTPPVELTAFGVSSQLYQNRLRHKVGHWVHFHQE